MLFINSPFARLGLNQAVLLVHRPPRGGVKLTWRLAIILELKLLPSSSRRLLCLLCPVLFFLSHLHSLKQSSITRFLLLSLLCLQALHLVSLLVNLCWQLIFIVKNLWSRISICIRVAKRKQTYVSTSSASSSCSCSGSSVLSTAACTTSSFAVGGLELAPKSDLLMITRQSSNRRTCFIRQ